MLKTLIESYLGVIYAALAVAIVGAGIYAYNTVYDRGWDARGVIAEKEKADMRRANDAAVASAEKGMREDVGALVLKIKELENASVSLDLEADKDSGATDVGVKRSGVQRLNAIR